MKKIVIGLLTALLIGVNASSAYAAQSCPRCGATVGRGENHKCCDYLGHDLKSHFKSYPGGDIIWSECTRCGYKTNEHIGDPHL
ncbi:hypothetical protein AGE29_06585 [Clostridium botulinum]|uniref:Uncharacterized protein n=1 Tax=Clostridium botulinum (strain 657 / Type Ba4) TaxID=515621 RepID=A0A3F3A5L7_CLOB6|nr:hypothetical protein [Clostridium botulinum]ACQ52502.1 hypothetical protein CLJ_B1421 [Clostridium botulinum Ba4 str. 657]AXG91453.1 hypothetical protein AGE29_06585 [Clostridium botulinum]NEZ81084.1 hypothetical protein [Clostridium botulinum]NFA18514.1 hypothetical protein [Clostridium botulinum]NFA55174.1 hypothetical protein [Clostridium botulinum]